MKLPAALALALLAFPALADQRYERLFYDASPKIIVIEPGTFDNAPRYRERENREYRAPRSVQAPEPVRRVVTSVPEAPVRRVSAPVRDVTTLPPSAPAKKQVRKVYPPEPAQAAVTSEPEIQAEVEQGDGPPAYSPPDTDRRPIDQRRANATPAVPPASQRRAVLTQPSRSEFLVPAAPPPSPEPQDGADEMHDEDDVSQTASALPPQPITLQPVKKTTAAVTEPNALVPMTPVAPLN